MNGAHFVLLALGAQIASYSSEWPYQSEWTMLCYMER